MALNDTTKRMRELLSNIMIDLEKASIKGNKAAAQRVRTNTIRLEKTAKQYRKDSIAFEHSPASRKKRASKPTKVVKAKHAAKPAAKQVAKPVAKSAPHLKAAQKGKHAAPLARAPQSSAKRPTAKLPFRNF